MSERGRLVARFEVQSTSIEGVRVVRRLAIEDERGFLSRVFCADEFAQHGMMAGIAQINHTLTKLPGMVRGMHFQAPPHAEAKLINCVRGEVFDVAVDLRKGSPTFLHWFGLRLSPENKCGLYIPPGCAHGFQTLTDNCELIYLHSAAYAPSAEGGIHPNDPSVSIAWPLPVSMMSNRDQGYPMINPSFEGLVL